MIIDFHTHCFPDALASRALAALSQVGKIPPHTEGTAKSLRSSMQNSGVDISVLLPVATKPSQAESLNAWASSENKDTLIAFGSVHPASSEWEKELEAVKTYGLKGIKLHPDYQAFFVDDPWVYPFYEKVISLGLVMVFHCGTDIGLPPPFHCMPHQLSKVLALFPKAKIVAAHMGAYRFWEEVEETLVGKPLYFDTAFALHEMPEAQFLRIVRHHGAENILFATDSPWVCQKEYVERLQKLPLTNYKYDCIAGRNAKELLTLL